MSEQISVFVRLKHAKTPLKLSRLVGIFMTETSNHPNQAESPSSPLPDPNLILRIIELHEQLVDRLEAAETRQNGFEALEDGLSPSSRSVALLERSVAIAERNALRLLAVEHRLDYLSKTLLQTEGRPVGESEPTPMRAPAYASGDGLRSALRDNHTIDPDSSIIDLVQDVEIREQRAFDGGSPTLVLQAADRVGLLHDVIRVISDEEGLNVGGLLVWAEDGIAQMTFSFSDKLSDDALSDLSAKIYARLNSLSSP